mmetsp:Transcript_23797/g.42322  ORF Transcript_23797/g.42322 Transcript_23797/m.42322 type:complete len:203 (-) Transcript_23797:369-977(-)
MASTSESRRSRISSCANWLLLYSTIAGMPASVKCWLKCSGVCFSAGKNSTRRLSILAFFISIISSSIDSFFRISRKNSVRKSATVPLAIMRSFSRDSNTSSGSTPNLLEKIMAVAMAIFFLPMPSKNSSDLRNLHIVFSKLLMRKGRRRISCRKVLMKGMMASVSASSPSKLTLRRALELSSREPPAAMRPPANSTSKRVSP